MRKTLPFAAAAFAAGLALTAGSAFAASAVQKECSTKYQAAKTANTLNGMTYNQYYKQCAAEAKADKAGGTPAAAPATPAPAPAAATPAIAPTPAPAPAAPTTTAQKPMTPTAPAAAGAAVFPTALSSEFSKESAGKARMHTCLAQYKANKTTNGNGGLKWIEKGGGYYSECNKRLKG
jgi:hypothetical protein